MRIGVASLNQIPLDWSGNSRRVCRALSLARAQGVDWLCLPELCLTGYGCEDAFLFSWVREKAWAMLMALCEQTKGFGAIFGMPLFYEGRCYNVLAVVFDGLLAGFYAKQHMAYRGVYYEPRWFSPWAGGSCRYF